MADTQQPQIRAVMPDRSANIAIPAPTSSGLSIDTRGTSLPSNNRIATLDNYTSPVNQNGCFEFDRVLKSGTVQKRTQKTKNWKPVHLVLRPNAISMYKSDKESKLRHKVNLADLTAVAMLKDPKHKRKNIFGCFSPARNYHFQANSDDDAREWVDLIRTHARIDEEEEELMLASSAGQRRSFMASLSRLAKPNNAPPAASGAATVERAERGVASSSPEPDMPMRRSAPGSGSGSGAGRRRASNIPESSAYSGNELASHSDFSDSDVQRVHGMSLENLAVQTPDDAGGATSERPGLAHRNSSQISGLNLERDPDRVAWQGWLWLLRNKGGVRQWKRQWAVLRPRNFILYKDESEYSAQFVQSLPEIIDVVDIDPVSRTKQHCLQLITEEKSYRFCAPDEESLVRCLGAFKSLITKRRELDARATTAE